jgi:hypothetical protein
MKYIFFTDLQTSKIAKAQKVVSKGAQHKFCQNYKKSFPRERSVSFLLKSSSQGNAESNTAEI